MRPKIRAPMAAQTAAVARATAGRPQQAPDDGHNDMTAAIVAKVARVPISGRRMMTGKKRPEDRAGRRDRIERCRRPSRRPRRSSSAAGSRPARPCPAPAVSARRAAASRPANRGMRRHFAHRTRRGMPGESGRLIGMTSAEDDRGDCDQAIEQPRVRPAIDHSAAEPVAERQEKQRHADQIGPDESGAAEIRGDQAARADLGRDTGEACHEGGERNQAGRAAPDLMCHLGKAPRLINRCIPISGPVYRGLTATYVDSRPLMSPITPASPYCGQSMLSA